MRAWSMSVSIPAIGIWLVCLPVPRPPAMAQEGNAERIADAKPGDVRVLASAAIRIPLEAVRVRTRRRQRANERLEQYRRPIEPGQQDVLGWSFSGPLALMVAAESPPGLRGVVICASFIRSPWAPLRWFRWAVVTSVARLFPFGAKVLRWVGFYGSTDVRQDQEEVFRRVTPSAFAARSRAALGVDARVAAAKCPVPVLYVAASHDVVVPRWNAKAVAASVPRAEVVTIRGPHLALRTNAAAGAAAVAKFVAELGST